MEISRNKLTETRSPWSSNDKTEQYLSEKAHQGWFLDGLKFKYFCTVAQFHFVRCEPIDAQFTYETMVPQLFNLENFKKELPDDWHYITQAENYVVCANKLPVLVNE